MSRRGVNPLRARFAQPGPRRGCQAQFSQSTLHIPHSALPPSHATLRFQLSPPYSLRSPTLHSSRYFLHTFRYASLCTLSAPPFTIRLKTLRSTLPTLHSALPSPFHALLVPVHIPAPVFTLSPLGTPTLHPTLSSTLFSKLSNPASSPLSRRIARNYPLKKKTYARAATICGFVDSIRFAEYFSWCYVFRLPCCLNRLVATQLWLMV